MPAPRAFSFGALPALSSVFLISEGRSPSPPQQANDHDPALEPGVPALFSWGDLDGDGRLDLAAIGSEGTLRLLASAGDGRFEDVTERVGLAGVENAALALWADYDADGRLDLFVGARAGASRLFHNEGGTFVDMSAGSGLASEGAVQSAEWLDHDGDGRLDLFLVTAVKSQLFRGLEGGFFELAELPFAGTLHAPGLALDSDVAGADHAATPPGPGSADGGVGESAGPSRSRALPTGGVKTAGNPILRSPTPGGAAPIPAMPAPTCVLSLRDAINVNPCIQASTTPTLGMLYPLSANLFVAVGGNVGVGTTSPTAKLHVAGTARVTDTLTLAPSGDQALDVSTGSIYKSGALFIHTKGGARNTALGLEALASVSSGINNTASGYRALFSNEGGFANTAHGALALSSNTDGYCNTANGKEALSANTIGFFNTACGYQALFYNTSGVGNAASGFQSLLYNTDGDYNTAVGAHALTLNTYGDRNSASGGRALNYNTTGSENTATGFEALESNTAGSENTATGFRALAGNTTSSGNTATGGHALYSNGSGTSNTATGASALRSNTTGTRNAANGYQALRFNTTGSFNAACGEGALRNNTTGDGNTASGLSALYASNGDHNTANGYWALRFNTSGSSNTACGKYALRSNLGGSGNIALGADSGSSLTSGSNNIAIGHSGVAGEGSTTRIGTAGTHTRAFVAGIHGVTTGVGDAIAVMIDSSGQLGTASSSRRFKEEIQDMGDATERLLELRPVTFRYKPEVQSGERPIEYGLIAEEVAELFPDLVVYDDEGQPFTVKYHLLSSMLLNELKKLGERLEVQGETHARELEALARELTEQRRALEAQQDQLARLRGLEEAGSREPILAPAMMPAGAR